MTITLNTVPGGKYLELGGGSNPMIHPNVDVRACYDAQGKPTVDFTADFNDPLPIKSSEWDGILCRFAIEHVSWRKIPQFLTEVFRILKPGGKFVCITANTEAQLQWIKDHPEGWDDKNSFDSCSCILFGDQDFIGNSHAAYLSPQIVSDLFQKADFVNALIQPYGERNTDLVIEAFKPASATTSGLEIITPPQPTLASINTVNNASLSSAERAALFDKHYFNGGLKVGGYAREGYWDFPVHHKTVRFVLARNPQSVLELGAGRGYILKRLQDTGIRAAGLEISKHCWMTRVADDIAQWNLCQLPWPIKDKEFDLAFSIATLEHIPEEFLPKIFDELSRTCQRGLHGIDLGSHDDGFDKTHCLSHKTVEWWQGKLPAGHEVIDKEEMEKGEMPADILAGDGKIKLNIGSFITMFHHGWQNLDIVDLAQFARIYQYNFRQLDVRQGLPYDTGSVSLIYLGHFLEHLTYQEGLAFLRECRRVLRPIGGAMRIIVPDIDLIIPPLYRDPVDLSYFDEINDGCAAHPMIAGKLWEMIFAGHQAAYDAPALLYYLKEAGFEAAKAGFRSNGFPYPGLQQILRETLDVLPILSLYADAFPSVEES